MTGTIFLEAGEVSLGETDGVVYVTIVRQGDLSGATQITYEITPSSTDAATAGVDYTATLSGVVFLDAGQDRVSIPINIIDDALGEPTETFVVSLINATSGTLLAPRTSRVDILDNETPVQDPGEPPLASDYDVSQDVVVTGLSQPIKFEFSPVDPSIVYVAEKGGLIKIYDIETGAFQNNFLDLRAEVNNIQDRGLLDIAMHPDFASNGYIYAFYVVDPADGAGLTGNAGPDGGGNRYSQLVRFTADPATGYTTIIPDSKVVLLGGAGQSLSDISGGGAIDSTNPSTSNPANSDYAPPSDIDPATGEYIQDYIKVDSRSHAGGALAFGPDGALYISTGDGTSFNFADPRSVTVQNVNSLAGKILRIDPLTGDGLADNPFVEAGDSLDSNKAKVYQLGLRNPYSIAFDQEGQLLITDTGWNSYEEINAGAAGANFGWPFYEGGDNGVLLTNGYSGLPEAAAFYAAVASGEIEITPAFRAFSHSSAAPGYQMQAITGGDVVYTGGQYPDAWDNNYFFTDVSQGEVFAVDVNDRRDVQFLYRTDSGFGPVHFTQGPDGYVYYADIVNGQIGRLRIDTLDLEPGTLLARGSAAFDAANNEYILTQAVNNQTGTVMSTSRIDLSQAATFSFDVFLGANDGGADGLGFVLHNDPAGVNAIGATGGGLGLSGIVNGLAIEFDTYNNLGTSGDLAADHTSVFDTNGTFRTAPVALPNIENGQWHSVTVSWDPATSTLSYSFDGAAAGSVTGDIANDYLGGSQFAYFGFAGATGGLNNQQKVRISDIDVAWEDVAPNIAPVAADDTGTTQAGTPLSLDVLANDTDADGDPLTIASVSAAANGTAVIDDNGTPADASDDLIRYTPNAGFAGTDSFTYVVSDGEDTDTASVSVTVQSRPTTVVVARETFESGAAGWTNNTTTNGGAAFSTFLGRFGGSPAPVTQKTFGVPNGADQLTISFLFYEIDSWDGDQNDRFAVIVDGQEIFLTPFYHQGRAGNNGTDPARSGQTGDVAWSITPLTSGQANLGFGSGGPYTDQLHQVTLVVDNPNSTVTLGFRSTLNQGIGDESFGVDNVEITATDNDGGIIPVPVTEIVIADQNFESGAAGWSNPLITNGGAAFSNFLGRFGGTSGPATQQSFDVPDGADRLEVAFDFYELDSWDGDENDSLAVYINGQQVLLEEFFHQGRAGNDGTDPARSGASGNVSWTITPVTSGQANLGFGGQSYATDQVHRVLLVIDQPGDAVTIGVGANLNQSIPDESFGIDNFTLKAFDTDGDMFLV